MQFLTADVQPGMTLGVLAHNSRAPAMAHHPRMAVEKLIPSGHGADGRRPLHCERGRIVWETKGEGRVSHTESHSIGAATSSLPAGAPPFYRS